MFACLFCDGQDTEDKNKESREKKTFLKSEIWFENFKRSKVQKPTLKDENQNYKKMFQIPLNF